MKPALIILAAFFILLTKGMALKAQTITVYKDDLNNCGKTVSIIALYDQKLKEIIVNYNGSVLDKKKWVKGQSAADAIRDIIKAKPIKECEEAEVNTKNKAALSQFVKGAAVSISLLPNIVTPRKEKIAENYELWETTTENRTYDIIFVDLTKEEPRSKVILSAVKDVYLLNTEDINKEQLLLDKFDKALQFISKNEEIGITDLYIQQDKNEASIVQIQGGASKKVQATAKLAESIRGKTKATVPAVIGTFYNVQLVKTTNANADYHNFSDAMTIIEDKYNCGDDKTKPVRMVSDQAFYKSLEAIFSKVILNSDNLIQNGSASNVDYSDGLNLSISYQKVSRAGNFFKFGFKTTLKDNFSTLFKGGKYQNEYTLNFGLTQVLPMSKRFFDRNDCDDLKSLRNIEEARLLTEYNERLNTDVTKLKAEITQLETELDKTNSPNLTSKESEEKNTLLATKKDLLSKAEKLRKDFITLGATKIINNDLEKFELAKAKFTGYRVHWINYDLTLPLKGYYLYDKTRTDTVRYKTMAGATITPSYNVVQNSKRLLFYLRAALQLNFDRGIATINSTDTLTRKYEGNNKLFYNVTNRAGYNLLSFGIAPSISSEAFFGEDKILGVETSFGFQKYLTSLDGGKDVTFNAKIGLLLSLKGEANLSTGVVGLFAQLKDYQTNQGPINKNYIIGVKLGVPFSAFSIK